MNNSRYAVGLDLGSAWTRCVICLHENDVFAYLGHAEVPSQGWTKGRISDSGGITASVRAAVAEAEKNAQATVEGAVVALGGPTIDGSNYRGVYEFGRPREVEPGDMTYAVELASKVRLQDDRTVLQVAPQDFIVDGRAGFRNPRGLCCSRLEATVHVITAGAHEHSAAIQAVHQASVAVEESVFDAAASAYACVLPEERQRGVAVIDIGAHTTELAVYDGDALLRASSIPIAGDHFTRDVAYGLTVSFEDADCLKREYGCAILGLTADNSLIEVPAGEGRAPREAPRKLLNEILEARAEELFLHVRNEIAKVGMEQQLLEGMVLTGGGALLNGMCDIAERVVNSPARNGLPLGILNWPEEINHPAWCGAAGLAMYSAKLKTRREWRRTAPGVLGLVMK